MTLSEMQDFLCEEKDDEDVTVLIDPPIENPEALTDCDSDASDNEVTCNPEHLPRRILLTTMVDSSTDREAPKDRQQPSTSTAPPSKRHRKVIHHWHKDKNSVTDIVGDYQTVSSMDTSAIKPKNPMEAITYFWTEEWIDLVCQQSKLYAQQRSLPSDQVNPSNLKVFMAILILSGYNKLPNRRLYWAESPDVMNQLVSNSMRRDTFDQIMRCLHFSDNMSMNDDRFYKVRPIFKHLNKISQHTCRGFCKEYCSIDEMMVPYYGKHGDKQYIRGKPVRFGFKLWGACASDGLLLHAEPYCGSCTRIPDRGMGHGPNVILEMAEVLKLEKGQHAIFDNYFGTIDLMKELSSKGIAATSTLREDRLSGAPLKARNYMNKEQRGYMEEAFTESVSLVKWKDNKVVSVASNKLRSRPIQKAKRWNRVLKKHMEVDVPNSVYVYNKHMGGVDLFNQQIACYRIRIRSKKWWWPIFAWSVNAQVVSAWMIYRKNEHDISLLDFSRELVISLMKTFGVIRKKTRPRSLSARSSLDAVRYNNMQHWTAKGESRYSRCRECGKRTVYICKMCDVPMHPECMEAFHKEN